MIKRKLAIVIPNVSNLWLVQSVGDCSGLELGRGKIYPSILHTHTHSPNSESSKDVKLPTLTLCLVMWRLRLMICKEGWRLDPLLLTFVHSFTIITVH